MFCTDDYSSNKYYISALRPPSSYDKPGKRISKKKLADLKAKGIVWRDRNTQQILKANSLKTWAQTEQF